MKKPLDKRLALAVIVYLLLMLHVPVGPAALPELPRGAVSSSGGETVEERNKRF